jgi:hypothetical protein
MAGENPDLSDSYNVNLDPDYDGPGFVDLSELEQLIEALDERGVGGYAGTNGREDWALERECEISRLERENEELRRLLGIDEGSVAATGVSLDTERVESGRYSTFLSSSLRRGPSSSGEGYNTRPSYWDTQQSHFQQQSGSGQLQRPMEVQPGMRLGGQGVVRRTGIFGGGRGRGGLPGIGTGSPGPSTLWSNQPVSPAPTIERPAWQGIAGSSLDLSR